MARLFDTLFLRRVARRVKGAGAAWPGMDVPLHTDWAWRPDPWREVVTPVERKPAEPGAALGSGVKVFHDTRNGVVSLRQEATEGDTPPFAVRLKTQDFDGGFLSLVVELPEGAVRDVERRHIIRLEAKVDAPQGIEIFARLNVRNGPNIEQIVRETASGGGALTAEFDLAYTKMNARRVDSIWLDVIFESRESAAILIRDMVLSRRPRLDV